jgi:hypothetical protein
MDRKLTDLINLVQSWIDRQEADGCDGCAFLNVEEWDLPCKECKRNNKDHYRRAESEE